MPTVGYALNHAVGRRDIVNFAAVSAQTSDTIQRYVNSNTVIGDAGPELERFVSTHKWLPETTLALSQEITDIRNEAVNYGSLRDVPAGMQGNVRNQMYLASEAIRLMPKFGPKISAADAGVPQPTIAPWPDKSTKFIPTWVKVAVALALGMGTMIGCKRIVVTVGEKIGKTHMTYAQGASAEIVTMATILGADHIGVPVSTTHILNSGVAGTMAANRSGLQLSTVRDIALAWIFTLPAAALLSASLFWLFSRFVHSARRDARLRVRFEPCPSRSCEISKPAIRRRSASRSLRYTRGRHAHRSETR